MKIIYFTLLLALGFVACKTGKNSQQPDNGDKKAFIPQSIGNYWVYQSTTGDIDTLKILSHEKTAEGLKVNLNSEKWLIKAGGDSIFVRCNTRGGGEFVMPLYIRSMQESTYNSCLGDVLIEVNASKLAEAQTVKGKTYKNCYLFELKPYTKVIVADGIGVIKYTYLDLDGKIQSERLLTSYKLN
jgi:hypothetical protein